MFWMMVFLSVGQVTAPPGADIRTILPTEGTGNCIQHLFELRVDAQLLVRCNSVRDGAPRDCRLESGFDQPVRVREAARCMARLYRFEESEGRPATTGPVSIPVRLRMNVEPPPTGFIPPGAS